MDANAVQNLTGSIIVDQSENLQAPALLPLVDSEPSSFDADVLHVSPSPVTVTSQQTSLSQAQLSEALQGLKHSELKVLRNLLAGKNPNTANIDSVLRSFASSSVVAENLAARLGNLISSGSSSFEQYSQAVVELLRQNSEGDDDITVRGLHASMQQLVLDPASVDPVNVLRDLIRQGGLMDANTPLCKSYTNLVRNLIDIPQLAELVQQRMTLIETRVKAKRAAIREELEQTVAAMPAGQVRAMLKLEAGQASITEARMIFEALPAQFLNQRIRKTWASGLSIPLPPYALSTGPSYDALREAAGNLQSILPRDHRENPRLGRITMLELLRSMDVYESEMLELSSSVDEKYKQNVEELQPEILTKILPNLIFAYDDHLLTVLNARAKELPVEEPAEQECQSFLFQLLSPRRSDG